MTDVIPTGAALGAEIRCGDVRDLDDAAMTEIRRAWLEHLVLVFRGQTLDKAALIAFGRRFGSLHHGTRRPAGMMPRDENFPEINVISNVIEDGLKLGNLGASEALWHTDRSHQEKPLSASLLYALEVPPAGGDTSWANMYRAFETLPAAMKDRIAELTIHHDASRDSAGAPRADFKGTGAHHPIVRSHPETGASALDLGRRSNTTVDNLSPQESDELLDALWAHATRPELAWTHRWRVGDIVIWDNRCTIHHRTAFDPNDRRVMHRLQVDGTRPFMAPDALVRPMHTSGAAPNVAS
ncbi:MAG: TauD/TfdA family dioxygenase [Rhodospirillales bacterium]